MLTFLRGQEKTLVEERDALQSELDAIVNTAQSESRTKLSEEESAEFQTRSQALKAKIAELDECRSNIKDAEDRESRSSREAEVRKETGQTGPKSEARTATVTVGDEPKTYRKGEPGGPSWVRDMTDMALNRAGSDVRERLARNAREVSVETRALSTTDGAGGEFVPPLWAVSSYIELARTARPTADRVVNQTLPAGTDSINVPKIATGTAVAEQTTQNTAVQNTDLTTTSVVANVATIAGQQVLPVQLIEQSPLNMDEIVLQDLAFDYAAKVDLFVLNNNATGKKGLLQESGTTSVTYTDASPTVGELYPKLQDAIQQIATNRYLPADTIVMHPRRWAWLLSALDTAGRPLVVPTAGQGAQNSLGNAGGVAAANGVVGNIGGLDVILDPQVPTNLGAGTNEDRIIVFRASDSILWEGAPHAEMFRETSAANLSVVCRFYRYAAFTTARYAKSVSIVSGTGLVAPTF